MSILSMSAKIRAKRAYRQGYQQGVANSQCGGLLGLGASEYTQAQAHWNSWIGASPITYSGRFTTPDFNYPPGSIVEIDNPPAFIPVDGAMFSSKPWYKFW